MAKPTILKERGSGEVLYPHTLASLVKTSDGGNAEDAITSKQDALTTSEDLNISADNELSLTDMAKKRLFIDMWNTAWTGPFLMDYPLPASQRIQSLGSYDPENAPDISKPFKAYDMWLTYEEAMTVMDDYKWAKGQTELQGVLKAARGKVALPIRYSTGDENIDMTDMMVYNKTIEEMCLCYDAYGHNWGVGIIKGRRTFDTQSDALRKIHGTVMLAKNINPSNLWAFLGCPNLEYVHIKQVKYSISLAESSKLSLDSVEYMVNNAINTTAITITVHADVYAKLTGDTTNAAAAALTPEELAQWQQVLTDAAEKNISFATV